MHESGLVSVGIEQAPACTSNERSAQVDVSKLENITMWLSMKIYDSLTRKQLT